MLQTQDIRWSPTKPNVPCGRSIRYNILDSVGLFILFL